MFITEAQTTPGTNQINPGQPPPEVPGSSPAGGGGAQALPPPRPAGPPPVNQSPPIGQPGAPPAPSSFDRTPTRKLLTGDTDELPDDADTYEISRGNFRKRLERHSKTQLKQLFGTDNVEEIVGWRRQAEEAKTREEEQRLAQMSEADRYKAQYEKAQTQAQHWRQQYEQLQEQQVMREQDQKVGALVARAVDPDCVDYVSLELAKHLQQADEADMGGNPEAYVDGWVKEFVARHPKFALASGAPQNGTGTGSDGTNGANGANGTANGQQPSSGNVHNYTPPGQQVGAGASGNGNGTQQQQRNGQPPPRQVQVPIHNGPTTVRPSTQHAAGQNPYVNKTAAPGQPNSLTDSEWRAYKREHGLDF